MPVTPGGVATAQADLDAASRSAQVSFHQLILIQTDTVITLSGHTLCPQAEMIA